MNGQREQIIEYLRGELEGDEKTAFEELLAKDAGFRKEVKKQKNLWDLFGKLPQVEANRNLKDRTLQSVKHYKNKSVKIRVFRVQDKIKQIKKKETRKLFTPLSAAAAVLILAAVIVAVLLSDSKNFNTPAKMAMDTMEAKENKSSEVTKFFDEEAEEKSSAKYDLSSEKLDEDAIKWSKNDVGNPPNLYENTKKLQPSRTPWPNTKIGKRSRQGSDKISDSLGGNYPAESLYKSKANDSKDGAPGNVTADDAEGYRGAKENSEKEEKPKELGINENDVYVYFLDLNNEMNVILNANQELNLPFDLKGKSLTRLDLAKHEISNDLNNISETNKFIVVVFQGSSIKAINSNGQLQNFTSVENNKLAATDKNISSARKALNSFNTYKARYSADDVLNSAHTWIESIMKSATNIKFFTSASVKNESNRSEEKQNRGFVKENLKSSVEIIDLGGDNGLKNWASSKGYSYSRR